MVVPAVANQVGLQPGSLAETVLSAETEVACQPVGEVEATAGPGDSRLPVMSTGVLVQAWALVYGVGAACPFQYVAFLLAGRHATAGVGAHQIHCSLGYGVLLSYIQPMKLKTTAVCNGMSPEILTYIMYHSLTCIYHLHLCNINSKTIYY